MNPALAAAIRDLLAKRHAEEARMRRHGASGHVLAAYQEATDELKRDLRQLWDVA